MRLPRLVMPQWLGIVAILAAGGVFVTLAWLAWRFYGAPLTPVAQDRHSVPIVLGLIASLYLLVVLSRVVHEPQYARFVQGRIQEAAYLGNWQLLAKAGFAVVALGFTYFQEGWSWPAGLTAWGAFLWAAASFIKDVSGAWLRPVQRETVFFLDPATTGDQDWLAGERALQVKPGDGVVEVAKRRIGVPPADWAVHAGSLMHLGVNRALQDASSPLSRSPLQRAPDRFQLSQALSLYREPALIHARSGGGLLYNEQKIRLATDLETLLAAPGPVAIQQTSYFDFICSNGLTRFLIASRDTISGSGVDMFDAVRSPAHRRVVPLAHSTLSNHIGGGTLAITRTGRLLVSKQGRLSLVASGLLAPAGSGSFDWADQRGATTLAEVVRRGLERELIEECEYRPADLHDTLLLGFARDLRRGAKPDFYAVTLVAAEPKVGRTEVGFIDQHESFALDHTSIAGLVASLRDIETAVQGRAATSLTMNLRLLIDANPEIHARIVRHLGGTP